MSHFIFALFIIQLKRPFHLPLQQFHEHCPMAAVHLGMVKLERDWECGLEPPLAVVYNDIHCYAVILYSLSLSGRR